MKHLFHNNAKVLALFIFLFVAKAQAQTYSLGTTSTGSLIGYSGKETTCDCPTGYVAVGYTGGSAAWMDRFQLICAKLNSDGTVGTSLSYATAVGPVSGASNDHNSIGNITATGNYALTSFSGTSTNYTTYGNFMSSLIGLATPITSIVSSNTNNSVNLSNFGPIGPSLGSVSVPAGNVIVGVVGESGSNAGTGNSYVAGLKLRYAPIMKTAIPTPLISSFTPTHGCSGINVTITGSNFTGTTAVSIAGKSVASFIVNSNTSITATVGSADITGTIKITTPNGIAISSGTFSIGSNVNVYAYVTNINANNVSVINTANNTISTTIPVGSTPWGVSASPDGSKVFIANTGSNTVSVINTSTNKVTNTITVGTNPSGIVCSHDGSRVYVANKGSYTVSVINTANNLVVSTIQVGALPWGITITPDDSKVYVADNGNDQVSVINTSNNSVIATVGVGIYPNGIVSSPDGSKVYVANASSVVSVINTATNTVSANVSVGTNPWGINVNPDGSRIYVSNQDVNSLSVIDAASNNVIATVNVGSSPKGVSVTPDGSKVYVASPISNTISVINTATNTLINTISAGNGAFGFGNFIANLVTACGSVPVKIVDFAVIGKGNQTQLDWNTENEENLSSYNIQHSTDGISFTNIGTVNAIGSGANSYQFTDNKPNNGINYYRLESIDKNGSISYSKVVTCQLSIFIYQLSIFPNPTRDLVTVKGNHIASIQMIDNIGRVVKVVSLKDATNPTISVSSLPTGVYHLRIQATDGKVSALGIVKE